MAKSLTLIVGLLSLSFVSFAEDEGHSKIIYEYKKYQKIDLGDFSIKGKITTPGDLTVQERKRKKFWRYLYHRSKFKKEIREDIWDVR